MNTEALLLELLLSGFFAIACFKARAAGADPLALKPRDILRLTDRIERLRRSRWQWFSMVLLVLVVRLQSRVPLTVELTVALLFVIFLALPTQKGQSKAVARGKQRPGGSNKKSRLPAFSHNLGR